MNQKYEFMIKQCFLIPILLFHILASQSINAQPQLDLSFGSNGIIGFDFEERHDRITKITVTDNGEIYAAGFARIGGNFTPSDFVIVKLDSEGRLIQSYASNGILRGTILDSATHTIEDITLDGSGNLYAGINASLNSMSQGFVLKFNEDGMIDSDFANDGCFKFPDEVGSHFITKVLFDPSENLFVSIGNAVSVHIAKLNLFGHIDSTFGSNGIASLEDPTRLIKMEDMRINSNGQIIGAMVTYSMDTFKASIVKITEQGSLDTTLSQIGVNLGILSGTITEMVLLNDESVLVAGAVYNGSFNDPFFIKFQSSGLADATFGENGMVVLGRDFGDIVKGLAVSNGSVFGVGSGTIYKLNDLGIPDTSWGMQGRFTATGIFEDLAFISENEFIVAGTLHNGQNLDFYLAKYNLVGETTANRENSNPEIDVKLLENPFQQSLKIYYDLIKDNKISIDLYDFQGRKIQTLQPLIFEGQGTHKKVFNVNPEIGPGSYLIRFNVEKRSKVIKVIKN